MSPVHCYPFIIPTVHLSPLPTCSTSLLLTGIGVHWHWCSLVLVLVLVLVLAFSGIGIWWHSLALVSIIVNLGSIVISTIISPYEQWLIGRVVVLYDVALGGAAVRPRCRWWCPCCCHCCVVVQKWDPLPPCEQRLAVAALGAVVVVQKWAWLGG